MVEFGWWELEGRKNTVSPLLEEFYVRPRAWTRPHRRRTDKSRGSLTRLGKNLGVRRSSLMQAGSRGVGVTSPTPHFPPHVDSFSLRSPRGVGTLLSCVGLVCGFACRCGGVHMEACVLLGLFPLGLAVQGSGPQGVAFFT